MAITEFATLRLKPNVKWEDILLHIHILEREQAAWSGYPLYFFDVLETPGEIILLSGWKDVEAHLEWIASDMNQKMRANLFPSLDVTGLLHLAIEPNESWAKARMLLYSKVDEGETSKEIPLDEHAIWKGKGADAEGKVEGTFRIVAFDSVGEFDNEIDAKATRLNRHETHETGTTSND